MKFPVFMQCLCVPSFFWLEVKEQLPGVVTLEQEVQVIQHGRIIKHIVHDLMTQQPAELK